MTATKIAPAPAKEEVEPAPPRKPGDIDPAIWERALEETRRKEAELGKRLFPNGKPIPIPSSDDYDI